MKYILTDSLLSLYTKSRGTFLIDDEFIKSIDTTVIVINGTECNTDSFNYNPVNDIIYTDQNDVTFSTGIIHPLSDFNHADEYFFKWYNGSSFTEMIPSIKNATPFRHLSNGEHIVVQGSNFYNSSRGNYINISAGDMSSDDWCTNDYKLYPTVINMFAAFNRCHMIFSLYKDNSNLPFADLYNMINDYYQPAVLYFSKRYDIYIIMASVLSAIRKYNKMSKGYTYEHNFSFDPSNIDNIFTHINEHDDQNAVYTCIVIDGDDYSDDEIEEIKSRYLHIPYYINKLSEINFL